jgi:hypothetical protein
MELSRTLFRRMFTFHELGIPTKKPTIVMVFQSYDWDLTINLMAFRRDYSWDLMIVTLWSFVTVRY